MMNNAWNMDGSMSANKKKGWKAEDNGKAASSGAPARGGRARGGAAAAMGMGGGSSRAVADEDSAPAMNMTEAQLMERFREKLAKRGNRGIMGLGRSFKIADDDRSGSLGSEEF